MNTIHPFDLSVFSNIPLWAAFFSWCSAQAIKLAIDFAKTRRVDFRYFVSTGGMPSAHSATVTGLATSLGLTQGWDAPITALASVFAIITMFDAATVRHAAGLQAQVLNGPRGLPLGHRLLDRVHDRLGPPPRRPRLTRAAAPPEKRLTPPPDSASLPAVLPISDPERSLP